MLGTFFTICLGFGLLILGNAIRLKVEQQQNRTKRETYSKKEKFYANI